MVCVLELHDLLMSCPQGSESSIANVDAVKGCLGHKVREYMQSAQVTTSHHHQLGDRV